MSDEATIRYYEELLAKTCAEAEEKLAARARELEKAQMDRAKLEEHAEIIDRRRIEMAAERDADSATIAKQVAAIVRTEAERDSARAEIAAMREVLENADAIFSALETERPVFAYDWGVGRSRALIRAALKGSPAPEPAEAMRDGAIYAAVSRAKDPEGYDKMLNEVTADARTELAAEAMRAKCHEQVTAAALKSKAADLCVYGPGDYLNGYQDACREIGGRIAALKGNGEGK